MKLKSIKLNNIRSYEDGEVIFPDSSILLSGDVGAGKTSVLMAIEYALFGLQPGQRGSALLSRHKDTGEVVLKFEIDGKEIIVERKLKRKSKSISQDSVSVTIDGEKTESSVTEIKTKIIDLLGYPIEYIRKNNLLYKYTVYTPQEEMKQIILEDPEYRLDILRHIFGIDRYKRIKENLARITSKLKENIRILQIESSNLELNKNKIMTDKKFVKILDEKISEKKEDVEKVLVYRKSVEEEIGKIEERIKERENFQKEIEKTKIMLGGKKEQLENESNFIRSLNEKIKQRETMKPLSSENIKYGIEGKKNEIEKLNSFYLEILSRIDSIKKIVRGEIETKGRIFKMDICPTCLQDITENYKYNIINEIDKKVKSLELEGKESFENKNNLLVDLEEKKKELNVFEGKKLEYEIYKVRVKEIEEAEEKKKLVEKNVVSLEKDIDFLANHVQMLKTSSFELMKYGNIYDLKKEELRDALQKEKREEIELAEFRKELELTKYEIEKMEEKIKEEENIRKKLIRLMELEDWFSNKFLGLINFVETNIMLALRVEFSRIFNKWFSMLTTDSFQVYLDESFSPVIMQGGFEMDYSFLSGGERTAVALAYRLALNQVINSMLSTIKTKDLIILDEPTDGFSDQQLDKVRDILQELNMGQLIIVSHEPKIESFVDNIVKLRKEKGVSFVES